LGREYPDFPIPAVSGVLFDGNDRILLICRANPPSRGEWSLPGGVVNPGETLEEALKREIQEECGLAVGVGPLVSVSSRIVPDKRNRIQYHYVLLDYLCRSDGGALRTGTDATEAQYIRISDLGKYHLTEGLIGIIRRGKEIMIQVNEDDFH
jgi:ADP-ribose pyrophosphatase YjhB (NUDIX family)